MNYKSAFCKIFLLLCGIVCAFVILEISLQTAGFITQKVHDTKVKKSLRNKNDIVILCIGESTTYEQYPVQLQQILDKHRPGKFTVIDKGIPGTTLEIINTYLDSWLDEYKPDIVLAMTGINNTYRQYWIPDFDKVDIFLQKFSKLKIVKLVHFLKNTYFKNKELGKEYSATCYILSNYPPEVDEIYINLDSLKQMRFSNPDLAVKEYQAFLEKYPGHRRTTKELAFLYLHELKNHTKAAEIATEQIQSGNPDFCYYYVRCSHYMEVYFKTNDSDILKLALDDARTFLNSDDNKLDIKFMVLAKIKNFISLQEYDDLTNALAKNQKTPPDWRYSVQAINLLEKKDKLGAKKLFTLASAIRTATIAPDTVKRFNEILEKIVNFGAKPFFMQYPVRKVEELKAMLSSSKYLPLVTFISNEKVFKQHIYENGFFSVFGDQFAGDFGHSLDTGNTLIAQNAAEAILKL
jgi:hypothetical protein